jgi:hypothetical protein
MRAKSAFLPQPQAFVWGSEAGGWVTYILQEKVERGRTKRC